MAVAKCVDALKGLEGKADLAQVAEGLNQVDELIDGMGGSFVARGDCAAMWEGLDRFVASLNVDGLLRARAMITARLLLQLDLAAGEGISALPAVTAVVRASHDFVNSAYRLLAGGDHGEGENEMAEVLQGAGACLRLVVDVGLRMAELRSGTIADLAPICGVLFGTINLSLCFIMLPNACQEWCSHLDGMALQALKDMTDLLDSAILPSVANAPNDILSMEAATVTVLLNGIIKICITHSSNPGSRRFGVINIGFKSLDRLMVRVRELEGEAGGDSQLVNQHTFDGGMVTKCMISVGEECIAGICKLSKSPCGGAKEGERHLKLLKFMVSRMVSCSDLAPLSFISCPEGLVSLASSVKQLLPPFAAPASLEDNIIRELQAGVSPSLDRILHNFLVNPDVPQSAREALLDILCGVPVVGDEALDKSLSSGVLLSLLNCIMSPLCCTSDIQMGICVRLPAALDSVGHSVPHMLGARECQSGGAGLYYRCSVALSTLVVGCEDAARGHAEKALLDCLALPKDSPGAVIQSSLAMDILSFLLRNSSTGDTDHLVMLLLDSLSASNCKAAVPYSRFQVACSRLIMQGVSRSSERTIHRVAYAMFDGASLTTLCSLTCVCSLLHAAAEVPERLPHGQQPGRILDASLKRARESLGDSSVSLDKLVCLLSIASESLSVSMGLKTPRSKEVLDHGIDLCCSVMLSPPLYQQSRLVDACIRLATSCIQGGALNRAQDLLPILCERRAEVLSAPYSLSILLSSCSTIPSDSRSRIGIATHLSSLWHALLLHAAPAMQHHLVSKFASFAKTTTLVAPGCNVVEMSVPVQRKQDVASLLKAQGGCPIIANTTGGMHAIDVACKAHEVAVQPAWAQVFGPLACSLQDSHCGEGFGLIDGDGGDVGSDDGVDDACACVELALEKLNDLIEATKKRRKRGVGETGEASRDAEQLRRTKQRIEGIVRIAARLV